MSSVTITGASYLSALEEKKEVTIGAVDASADHKTVQDEKLSPFEAYVCDLQTKIKSQRTVVDQLQTQGESLMQKFKTAQCLYDCQRRLYSWNDRYDPCRRFMPKGNNARRLMARAIDRSRFKNTTVEAETPPNLMEIGAEYKEDLTLEQIETERAEAKKQSDAYKKAAHDLDLVYDEMTWNLREFHYESMALDDMKRKLARCELEQRLREKYVEYAKVHGVVPENVRSTIVDDDLYRLCNQHHHIVMCKRIGTDATVVMPDGEHWSDLTVFNIEHDKLADVPDTDIFTGRFPKLFSNRF